MTAQVEPLLFCGAGVNKSLHLKLEHPRLLLHWKHLTTSCFADYKERSDDNYKRIVEPVYKGQYE